MDTPVHRQRQPVRPSGSLGSGLRGHGHGLDVHGPDVDASHGFHSTAASFPSGRPKGTHGGASPVRVSRSKNRLLVYGAYGYTARLLLPKLKALGIDVVVAGRNAEKTDQVGSELGMPSRVFSLDDGAAVDDALKDATAVLNAAGPYTHTTTAMVDGCLLRASTPVLGRRRGRL